MTRSTRLAGIVLPLALAACTVGPDYRRPEPPGGAAPQLQAAEAAGVSASPLPARWWRLFGDAALDMLVERALANNSDLRVAAANLQRARAVLSEARAGALPSAGLTTQYVRQRFGGQVFNAVGGFPPSTTDFYSVGADASYEVDLFGGVSRSIRAAIANRQAAQAQVDATRVAVAAETASTYATICALAARAVPLRRSAALAREALALAGETTRAGRTDARTLLAAESAVADAEALLVPVESEHRAALYSLAFLVGDPPEKRDEAASRCTAVPAIAEPIPVGDGRALIARRPDVRAAERQLARDTERIGVAVAAFYPAIRLNGSATLGSASLDGLGSSRSFGFSVGPTITWSLPIDGAARARVRTAKADAEGSLANFDRAVLSALRETEQALTRLGAAAKLEAELAKADAVSRKRMGLVEIRYSAGADNALAQIEARQRAAAAAAGLAQASGQRAQAQVQLFRALGGGWETPSQ